MNNKLKKNNDKWLYRIAITLAMTGQSTSEVIVALRSAAISGLAGLLAPSLLNR